MAAIFIWGILTLMLAFMLGGLLPKNIQTDNERDLDHIVLVFCCVFAACFALYLNANRRYYDGKEYSSVKYELKKKVITIEEDDTIELDTIYTFRPKVKFKG